METLWRFQAFDDGHFFLGGVARLNHVGSTIL